MSVRDFYDRMVLIETSAVIALYGPTERYHLTAKAFFEAAEGFQWFTLDVTAHEAFTRGRYDHGFARAKQHYEFLRGAPCRLLKFSPEDERAALDLLEKYRQHALSFHDALCATVMMREGIFRIFSFDSDFWTMGFEVLPGKTG